MPPGSWSADRPARVVLNDDEGCQDVSRAAPSVSSRSALSRTASVMAALSARLMPAAKTRGLSTRSMRTAARNRCSSSDSASRTCCGTTTSPPRTRSIRASRRTLPRNISGLASATRVKAAAGPPPDPRDRSSTPDPGRATGESCHVTEAQTGNLGGVREGYFPTPVRVARTFEQERACASSDRPPQQGGAVDPHSLSGALQPRHLAFRQSQRHGYLLHVYNSISCIRGPCATSTGTDAAPTLGTAHAAY